MTRPWSVNAKDYDGAFTLFEKAARLGDADAQNALGTCYCYGFGLGKDKSKGAHWYEKAAARGDEDAKKVLRERF